ncbi:protein takeout-like [Vespa crabro]|uniref:protein takeout-like n=1 Tax=Vespa crabro TaxID=7445 RepID=UPI001F02B4EA|nr:protein takeout-like [Vespa crabro]
MEKYLILFLTFLLNIAYCVSELYIPKLPPFIKICHRSDPNWSRCMKTSIEQIKPYLKEGIPDFHIPPCEPLYIDRLDFNQTTGTSFITSSFTDIKIYNGINFDLKNIKFDVNKNELKLKIYNPYLETVSKYNLNGNIMKLPLSGNGLSSVNLTDTDFFLKIPLERYHEPKTNQEHFRVNDIYVDYNIHNVKLHLNDLFDDDKILTDVMNLFLNDNWKLIANKFKPILEETVAGKFKTIMNNIFSKYPIDTLLPL